MSFDSPKVVSPDAVATVKQLNELNDIFRSGRINFVDGLRLVQGTL